METQASMVFQGVLVLAVLEQLIAAELAGPELLGRDTLVEPYLAAQQLLTTKVALVAAVLERLVEAHLL
jgi:hypothetical protein